MGIGRLNREQKVDFIENIVGQENDGFQNAHSELMYHDTSTIIDKEYEMAYNKAVFLAELSGLIST